MVMGSQVKSHRCMITLNRYSLEILDIVLFGDLIINLHVPKVNQILIVTAIDYSLSVGDFGHKYLAHWLLVISNSST